MAEHVKIESIVEAARDGYAHYAAGIVVCESCGKWIAKIVGVAELPPGPQTTGDTPQQAIEGLVILGRRMARTGVDERCPPLKFGHKRGYGRKES